MQYESAVFRCGKPRFAVYWFRAVLLTSIPSRLCYSTSTYRSREIQKEERFPPNRRCGSVETCRKALRLRRARDRSLRRQNGYSLCIWQRSF